MCFSHIRIILTVLIVLRVESISRFSFLFLKEDSPGHVADVEGVCRVYERGERKRRKARAAPQEGSWDPSRLPGAGSTVTPACHCGQVPGFCQVRGRGVQRTKPAPCLGGECPWSIRCVIATCPHVPASTWLRSVRYFLDQRTYFWVCTSSFYFSWIANQFTKAFITAGSSTGTVPVLLKCIVYIFSIINFKKDVFACLSLWRKMCPYSSTWFVDNCNFNQI